MWKIRIIGGGASITLLKLLRNLPLIGSFGVQCDKFLLKSNVLFSNKRVPFEGISGEDSIISNLLIYKVSCGHNS